MSDDRFLERLREGAAPLRFEPDDAALTRISARIRARVAAPAPTVSQLLAAWFRPLSLSLAAVALASSLGLAYYEEQQPQTVESTIAQTSIDAELAGYGFGD